MTRVWFTADLHLNHSFVAYLRGYEGPDDHDADLILGWNRLVAPEDTVWVLGDVVIGKWPLGVKKMKALNGRKYLVAGNHDRCHPMHRKAPREVIRFTEGDGMFDYVASSARVALPGGGRVLCSHFPYAGEGGRDIAERFSQWRLKDEGETLVHGHTHSTQRFSWSPGGTPQVHVGLDAWGRPASGKEVEELIERHGDAGE